MITSIRFAAIGLMVFSYAMTAQNVRSMIDTADAVVVGRSSDGVDLVDGVGFKLTVVRTLQGEPLPGQMLNVTMRLPRHPEVTPSKEVKGECGLFILRRTSSGWEMEGSGNSPFFSSAVTRLGDCEAAPVYSEGANTFERSIEEIVSAAMSAPKDSPTPLNLFDQTALSKSPIVARIMEDLSHSEVPRLKVEGVAWRVANGDASAVQEMARLLVTEPNSEFARTGPFSSAVFEYVNADEAGVAALGQIVLDPNIKNPYLQRSAAHALRNIHTRAAVPYLGEMLNSEDIEIRTEAVSGLTEYVTGVRPVRDGPDKQEALDEALNPGRRKGAPILVDQEYLHMGGFTDAGQESRVTAYWREWWQSNKSEFPSLATK